jgi:dTDP-4-dehydrorhamnose reductase
MSRLTAVVIGANGQLGSDIVSWWSSQGVAVVPLTHADIAIEDIDSVRNVLGARRPDIVLSTAAFHNVPKCEEDPARSHAVNSLGALNLARTCASLGSTLATVSTDYVFDGAQRRPYLETDAPNPLNVYGATKLLGEYYTLNYAPRAYVFRVSGIYGRVPCRAKGGNFITTMLRAARERPEVRVVTDEVLTPTPTMEIAKASLAILQNGAPGLYHVTAEGECSWFEFAQVIFETLGLKTPLTPAMVADFPSPVRRPTYSVLEKGALKSQGLPLLPHWRDALVEFLRTSNG